MGSEKVEQFEVMEWKIRNLCFWNKEIHGKLLEEWYLGLGLFPGGINGDDGRLVVQVHDTSSTSVDISFIGSDGSLLCKQQINNLKCEDSFEVLPPGPKFEEIVRARKKNPECKDTLTILCQIKKDGGLRYYAETNLVALDTCLRVRNGIFNDVKFGQPKCISEIGCLGKDGDDISMSLFFSFNSVTDDAKILITLKVDSDEKQVSIHTNLSLRDTDDSVINNHENYHFFPGTEEWIFSDVLQKNEVNGNGYSLIIHLKVITGVIEGNKAYSTSLKQYAEIVTLSSNAKNSTTLLSKELVCLYQDQDHADFHLHCGNVKFATHKAILSARSPVFKSMLSCGMKEAVSGSMEITDLDVNTLGRFLAFLYSGSVEYLQWENAIKLYYSADKYQVLSLKNECKAILTSSVSALNVCRILSLASKHQDDDLLSVTREFLSGNYHEVLESEEWKNFMLDEPYLASETLTCILLTKSTQ